MKEMAKIREFFVRKEVCSEIGDNRKTKQAPPKRIFDIEVYVP